MCGFFLHIYFFLFSFFLFISLLYLVVIMVMISVVVFNATFNNISVISWWSIVLVEETRVPGENHRFAASRRQTLSHTDVSSTSRLSGIRSHSVSLFI